MHKYRKIKPKAKVRSSRRFLQIKHLKNNHRKIKLRKNTLFG